MFYTIFCIIVGENCAISVVIDSGHAMGHLERPIKAEKPQGLTTIDADAISLYQIDVAGTDEEYIKEVYALAGNLRSLKKLNVLEQLEDVLLFVTRPPISEDPHPRSATRTWTIPLAPNGLFSLPHLPRGVSGNNVCICTMY